MAIYNVLAKARDRLTVEVLGIAASAASVIALAGRELVMDEGSYLMIHEPWGITAGPADDHRKTADVLDKMTGNFADLYASHSGLSRDEALAAMKDETWYTASEAVDAGFADGVGQGAEIAASAEDLARFKYQHAPSGLAQIEKKPDPPSTPRELEGALRDAGYSKSIAAAIVKRGFAAVREGVTDETDGGSPSTTTVAAAASAKGKRRDTIECSSVLAEIQQLQKGVRK
jgi:ClpP class serine protease